VDLERSAHNAKQVLSIDDEAVAMANDTTIASRPPPGRTTSAAPIALASGCGPEL